MIMRWIFGVMLATLAAALWAWQVNIAPELELAIDYCELEEYEQECELALWEEPKELEACKAKSVAEATRIAGGIPVQCKERR